MTEPRPTLYALIQDVVHFEHVQHRPACWLVDHDRLPSFGRLDALDRIQIDYESQLSMSPVAGALLARTSPSNEKLEGWEALMVQTTPHRDSFRRPTSARESTIPSLVSRARLPRF